MINEDELSKINSIFKSGDITLALMLIESQGFDLKDVLLKLYDKYKEEVWWVLNGDDYNDIFTICIKYINRFDNERVRINYNVWLMDDEGLPYKTLNDAIETIIEFIQQFK